ARPGRVPAARGRPGRRRGGPGGGRRHARSGPGVRARPDRHRHRRGDRHRGRARRPPRGGLGHPPGRAHRRRPRQPHATGDPRDAGARPPLRRRRSTMAYYRRVGNVPPKRHTQHRNPEGGLYYEELMGEEGFSSDSSLLYHRNIPSAIADSRVWDLGDMSTVPNHPLKPRHLKLHDLFATEEERRGVDVVTGRRLVLGNADVRLLYVVAATPSPYYRNGIGDECIYVERGAARVETVFGSFEVAEGDYIVIPRATTHRWIPKVEGDEGYTEPLRCYCIEANSHITPPKRYLSRFGQFLEHAPYCERDLRGPEGPLLAEDIGADPTEHTDVY